MAFFSEFCCDGFKRGEVRVRTTTRLGEPAEKGNTSAKPRPLKSLLEDKDAKASIFGHLKNLKGADSFKSVSVSHDYSKETREIMKEKINAAKEKDGENAKMYVYFVRGPPSHLELQRKKKINTTGA